MPAAAHPHSFAARECGGGHDHAIGELARIMRAADVRAKLVSLGADPIGSTPEEFAAFRKAEFTRLSALVAKAGIKSE